VTNWETIMKSELEEREANPNPREEETYAEISPVDRVNFTSPPFLCIIFASVSTGIVSK